MGLMAQGKYCVMDTIIIFVLGINKCIQKSRSRYAYHQSVTIIIFFLIFTTTKIEPVI